jgi:hypothetical protein
MVREINKTGIYRSGTVDTVCRDFLSNVGSHTAELLLRCAQDYIYFLSVCSGEEDLKMSRRVEEVYKSGLWLGRKVA